MRKNKTISTLSTIKENMLVKQKLDSKEKMIFMIKIIKVIPFKTIIHKVSKSSINLMKLQTLVQEKTTIHSNNNTMMIIMADKKTLITTMRKVIKEMKMKNIDTESKRETLKIRNHMKEKEVSIMKIEGKIIRIQAKKVPRNIERVSLLEKDSNNLI